MGCAVELDQFVLSTLDSIHYPVAFYVMLILLLFLLLLFLHVCLNQRYSKHLKSRFLKCESIYSVLKVISRP